MITTWLTYLLAAAAASSVFILAGRRSKQASIAPDQGSGGIPAGAPWNEPDIDPGTGQAQADVGDAIRVALKRLDSVMASRSVQAEIAAPSGLLVRMRAPALTDLLEELLTAAIHAAPACSLLLTATRRGDRIYIGVTDDMPGANPAVRVGSIRGLMERVAMRGGALDVDVRPMEGTSMTLRFAAVTDDRQDKKDHAPAKIGNPVPFQSASMAARN